MQKSKFTTVYTWIFNIALIHDESNSVHEQNCFGQCERGVRHRWVKFPQHLRVHDDVVLSMATILVYKTSDVVLNAIPYIFRSCLPNSNSNLRSPLFFIFFFFFSFPFSFFSPPLNNQIFRRKADIERKAMDLKLLLTMVLPICRETGAFLRGCVRGFPATVCQSFVKTTIRRSFGIGSRFHALPFGCQWSLLYFVSWSPF